MRTKQNRCAATEPTTMRWFRFGPGLALAVIASLIVWRSIPTDKAGPLRVERTPLPVTGATGLSMPDPAWLLAKRETLRLTASQVTRLKRLQTHWEHGTQALQAALNQASTHFAQTMPALGGHGVAIQQIQEQAAPVSQLTHELLQSRRAWWNEAGRVLTPLQQQQAERSWAQRFTTKTGANRT